MKRMFTGPMQFTPYQPWSEERKAARRAAIARARGREIVIEEPKREYCGPYLIALPPPSHMMKYVPSVPPYRIVRTYPGGYKEEMPERYSHSRDAMLPLWRLPLDLHSMAEVVDAEGRWIASATCGDAVKHS